MDLETPLGGEIEAARLTLETVLMSGFAMLPQFFLRFKEGVASFARVARFRVPLPQVIGEIRPEQKLVSTLFAHVLLQRIRLLRSA